MEPYTVRSSKFIGGNDKDGYLYEIKFNRSLQHTGRFSGIEDGLNEYERKERLSDLKESAQDTCSLFGHWFKGLFKRKT